MARRGASPKRPSINSCKVKRVRRLDHFRRLGFTLLEVVLIVAIIGMMMLMIVGYILAPKNNGPLPPVDAPKLIPGSNTPAPAAAPVPTSTPAKPVELAPGAVPAFR